MSEYSEKPKIVSVGKRGEIVIPAMVREQAGLAYGTELVVEATSTGINLVPRSFANFKKKWANRAKSKTSSTSYDKSDEEREKKLTKIMKKKNK